jgi:hypothetical protein
MGKGGIGTNETRGVGGGREIKEEEGWGWQRGASCLVSLGGTHSWRGAAGNQDRGSGKDVGEGGGTDEKLADLVNVWRKETRED